MLRPRPTVIALACAAVLLPACDKKEEASTPAASDSKKDEDPKEDDLGAAEQYMRKSKASEARVQLAKLSDSAAAYFMEEHVSRDGTPQPHRCPSDGNAEGKGTVTPPLSTKCNDGPKGNCSAGGSGPGSYDAALWLDNQLWQELNFAIEGGHRYHYNFVWKNDPAGFGSCQFTAQAFGDLDGDGLFSTYERSGKLDADGFTPGVGLYIDRELE